MLKTSCSVAPLILKNGLKFFAVLSNANATTSDHSESHLNIFSGALTEV